MDAYNNTPPLGQDGELLTKPELAKRLKKTIRSIDYWVHDGIIPCIKFRNTCLFDWPSVCAALEQFHGKEAK